jgi:transcriptional regulator with XRE-family HTH domain
MQPSIMWSEVIKSLRSRGLSQRAIAVRVGVDQSTISRLEDGRITDPRHSLACALLDLQRRHEVAANDAPATAGQGA